MNVEGKRISVIGAARSGLAAALLLQEKGASVFVTENGRVGESVRPLLEERGVAWEEGAHGARAFDADLCVVSPGVPADAPVLGKMKEAGIAVVSEIEIAFRFCPARIIGITGTDGKTTTASLVAAICAEDGRQRGYRAFSAGNIGVPFSSLVTQMREEDVAVVELSSYQLERCDRFRPEVAVITNIAPDHLDRYGGSMERYAEAKYRISARQRGSDTLVYNAGDPMLRKRFGKKRHNGPRLLPFGVNGEAASCGAGSFAAMNGDWLTLVSEGREERVIDTDSLFKRSFRGRHNLENALAAVAAAGAAGISPAPIGRALRVFGGVEHRQEYVRTVRGVDWINDSKATNLNALRRALESTPGKLVLIAGGRSKGADFRELAPSVERKVSALVVFGESAGTLADALAGVVEVRRADSLSGAVSEAGSLASPGETVLFSPGCASFDMFRDFEERGREFKKLVPEVRE